MATTAIRSTSITDNDPNPIYVDSPASTSPATSSPIAATTSTTTASTDLGAVLSAAIAGGYVAHLSGTATYTVGSPIVINVNSTIQGPLGIDLGGATIVSQIADGSPVIQINVGPGVDFRYLTLSNFTIAGNGSEGSGISLVADGNDRWAYCWTINNVTVKDVGGYGIDMRGSVFEGIVSNSWMVGNDQGGAYFSHATGPGGGQVSALRWFGGGFDSNNGDGIVLDNGARDISVDGVVFSHNNGVGISAASGVTSVTSSTFVDNKTAGVWFQNYGNFSDNDFTSSGAQTYGITGWLNGGATVIGNTSTYTGTGADSTVLANLQGVGSAFLSDDNGNIVTGANVAVSGEGGGNLAHVSYASQGVALPTLAAVTAATTADVATSSGTGPLELALKDAIASNTVVHLTETTYTVTSSIVINIANSTQGPVGIDLGGAKIISQVTGGEPVIEIIVGAGVDVGTLTLSNFSIQGNGSEGDGIKIVVNGTDRWIRDLDVNYVNVEHVGGIGLDVIGNVQGTVFDSWMHGNDQAGARFANSPAGGVASALEWVGGGFRKNDGAGLILDNGAHDLTVQGAYFVDNGGPGIYATSGIALVEQSGFENNLGTGALIQGTSNFRDVTFSTYGRQTVAIGGYLSDDQLSLIGVSNEYYGGGMDPTVLTNIQGTGTLAIAGTGNVVVGSAITVTGGDPYEPLPADATAPAITSIAASGIGIAAGSGQLNAGDVVTLTVEMSETVTVTGTPILTLNDGGTAAYTGGSGTSTLTFSYTVQSGQNTPDLAIANFDLNGGSVVDGAGNSAVLTGAANYNPAGTLVVDTTAASVTSIVASGSAITAGSGALNAGKIVTLAVTMSEAVTVTGIPTLTLNSGGSAIYVGGSGSSTLVFSYTVQSGQAAADLIVNSLNLNGGSILDAAGNSANLAAATGYNPAGTLQIDTVGPPLTAALVSDTGASPADHITSSAILTGTAEPGAVVRFTIDGTAVTATATAGANGAWSFTPIGLADGAHTIVASTSDAASNSTSTSLAFTLDTTAPAVTVELAPSLTVEAQGTASGPGQALAGTAEANAIVRFTVDGSAVAAATTADSTGRWFYVLTGLDAGAHTVVASQSDAAGNTGSASVSFTTSGSKPVLTAKLANDTGASSADQITSSAAMTGAADPNAVIHFVVDGQAVSSTVTADSSGVWSFTPIGLGNGQHLIEAIETNAQGLTNSTSLSFTLDTRTETPVFTGATYAGGQVTLTGTAEDGSTIEIYDGWTWLGYASTGSDGRFSFTAWDPPDAEHAYGAIATDLAGNEGRTTSHYEPLVMAAEPPLVMQRLANDSGSSATDAITADASLTGSADPYATVRFTLDGTALSQTATTDASGNWSFSPTGLSDGTHTIVASQTNEAGATGSSFLTFTFDTAAPEVVITGTTQANGKVTLTGTTGGTAGDTLSIYDGYAWAGFATTAADGSFSFTTDGAADSVHSYGANANDLAGNLGRTEGVAILGSTTANTLSGGSGGDLLQGGGGADTLTGGAGADRFAYRAASESRSNAADTITDFMHGSDKIDFTNIAGIATNGGVVRFQGKLAGTGNQTLNANSVAYIETGGNTHVVVNTSDAAETVTATNADAAEMKIVLLGVDLGLTADDFRHS